MISGVPLSLALALGLALAPSPALALPDRPLRQHHSILEYLAPEDISPPLPRQVPLECLGNQVHPPWENPFSPLPRALSTRHQRITLSPGPAAVEFSDALLIEPHHRLRFHLVPLADPRLELSYRVFRCGGQRAPLALRVTVTDAIGTWTSHHPLAPGRRQAESAFHELVVELPVAADAPFLLDLEVVSASDTPPRDPTPDRRPGRPTASKGFLVALADPTLTGLAETPTEADTNVLWIVIDAVRHDAMGPGRTFSPSASPELDARVFARGTAFSHAYAMANQTRTSTTAMLASVPASIGGFHSHSWAFTSGKRESFYARSPSLVPRVLSRHGFVTRHIGHNHFIWGSEIIGIDHGFARALDFRAVPADATLATAAARAFFKRHRDSRWMLMLNYTAPHTPYRPPEAFLERARRLQGEPSDARVGFLPRSYLGEILWVDHNLEAVFAELEDLGLLDSTLVIVTADHGEVMNPAHDCSSAHLEQPCSFNHGVTVYDDELRVPLALALPGRILPSRTVDVRVSHADLAPTVLDLLGLPPARNHVGRSLRPFLDGRGRGQDPIYADGRLAAAFVLGDAKLIVHAPHDDIRPRPRMVDGEVSRYELFDLALDPLELTNRAPTDKALIPRLTADLDRLRAELRLRFEGRGSASGSPSLFSPPPSSRATNQVLVTSASPRSFSIRVTSTATLDCLAASTDPAATTAATRCERLDEHQLLLAGEARPDRPARLSFWSTPADPGLELQATLGDSPLAPHRLRLGPWGLALLRPGETLTPARLPLADSPRPPIPQPRDDAVYLWRQVEVLASDLASSSPGAPAAPLAPEDGPLDPGGDAALHGEVKKILRDLGYTR